MTWAKIILLVLEFVKWAIEYGQQQKWIKEGEDRVIARSLAEITRKTNYAQETLADISKLSSDDTDALLRTLEGPGEPEGKR